MSMDQRRVEGSDPASRLVDIENMTSAAMQLVEAGQHELAEQVLTKIGQRATNGEEGRKHDIQ